MDTSEDAAPAAASTPQEETMESLKTRIVLEFLAQHGYQNTEQALRAEAKIPLPPSATDPTSALKLSLPLPSTDLETADTLPAPLNALLLTSVLNKVTQAHSLLSARNNNELHPSRFEASYKSLGRWISTLPSEFQAELEPVKWPVFVHMYLDLIEKGFTMDAIEFFEKYSIEHKGQDKQSRVMDVLQKVQKDTQLASNGMAVQFRKNKVEISLTAVSSQLLHAFLHGLDFMVIETIVNKHVTETITANALPRKIHKKVVEDSTVTWGLLAQDKTMVNEANAIRAQEGKKLLPPPANLSINTRIPLPRPKKRHYNATIQDLAASVDLDVQKLPSAACYTFVNASKSVNTVAISPQGNLVAAGMADSSVRHWDLQKQRSHSSRYGSLDAISSQDPVQLTASRQQSSSTSGSTHRVTPVTYPELAYDRFIGHSGPVFALDYSPDEQFLLSGSEDGTVRLWSTESKSNLVCYRGHSFAVWDVAFSPLGFYFASASQDGTARLWSTNRITPLRVFASHTKDVLTSTFHPNNQYLATGSMDKTSRLWDISTGDCVRVFAEHTDAVNTVAISATGRLLATGGDDNTVRVWDISTGKQMGVLKGHTDRITSVAFSNETALLSSGSLDGTIRTWSLDELDTNDKTIDGEESTALVATWHTKANTKITKIAYSPKNYIIAAGILG